MKKIFLLIFGIAFLDIILLPFVFAGINTDNSNSESLDEWSMSSRYLNGSNDFPQSMNYLQNMRLVKSYYLGGNIGSPVVSNNILYVSSGSSTYAINLSSDSINLIFNFTQGSFSDVSPAISNNLLYLSNKDTYVRALYLNGTEKWNYSVGSRGSSPVVYLGILYVSSFSGGVVTALNSSNGSLIWKYISSQDYSDACFSPPSISSSGLIYVSDYHWGYVFALNSSNGVSVWNNTFNACSSSQGGNSVNPVVSDFTGLVYSNGCSINATNGSKICSFNLGYNSAPASFFNDFVYYHNWATSTFFSLYSNNCSLYKSLSLGSGYVPPVVFSNRYLVTSTSHTTASGNPGLFLVDGFSGVQKDYIKVNLSDSRIIYLNNTLYAGTFDGYINQYSWVNSPVDVVEIKIMGGGAMPPINEWYGKVKSGASLHDVLYFWNPNAFNNLNQYFSDFFSSEEFSNVADNGYQFFVNLIKYIFRQPASMVSQEGI